MILSSTAREYSDPMQKDFPTILIKKRKQIKWSMQSMIKTIKYELENTAQNQYQID